MTPEKFIGLGEPKCQLYKNLQKMINDNGGRNRLAELLEREQNKLFKQDYFWTNRATLYLLTNYKTKTMEQISIDLNRSFESVKSKIRRMHDMARLDYKNNI